MAPETKLQRTGRLAWTVVGVALVAWGAALVAGRLSLVVIPVVLALFPAAVMYPAAAWMRRRGMPATLAALLLLLALLGLIGLVLWLVVPRFVAELPNLVEAVQQGAANLEQSVPWSALPGQASSVQDLLQRGMDALGGASGILGSGLTAAGLAADALTILLIVVVALFFYLQDGPRMWRGILDLLPADRQPGAQEMASRVWWTVGAYFKGQALVALSDAVLIGLGLFALGVPLALPLAVLVFIGGFFPIVGAFVSGLLAVLVALADQGLTTALLVLGLILLVQLIEGNVLQPLIMSGIVSLHPFLVILVITAGGVLLGVLGAFLAVPVAASVARVVDYLRGRTPEAGPGSDEESESEETPESDPAGDADGAREPG